MNTLPIPPIRRIRHEAGSVLLTGLIFLMILSMIVLSMLSGGTLEERMAANDRDRQIALQSAEAVLRDAEATLSASPFYPYSADSFTTACTNGFCNALDSSTSPRWKTINWTSSTNTRTFAATDSQLYSGSSFVQPNYIIEVVSEPIEARPVLKVNVTAHGLGLNNAEVFIQSTYEIPQPGQ